MLGPGTRRAIPTQRGSDGAVAAGHPAEVAAGLQVLEEGGTAVDAVIAAAFVGYVVEQHDCGLGGFARISTWNAARCEHAGFDGYVQAPAGARPDMFAVEDSPDSYYGHPETVGQRSRYGPLAVAIPGAVAGLAAAHEDGGRLPWARLLEPAIRLAQRGVAFSWMQALVIGQLRGRIAAMPETARVLLPGGEIPHIAVQHDDASVMDTRQLARTLQRIAEGGAAGFYTGRTAEALSAFVRDGGGILSTEDLAEYRARDVDGPVTRFGDAEVFACGDRVSHLALSLLDGLELGPPDGLRARHLMAEALGVAFTDVLTHDADPAFVEAPLRGLESRDYAAFRRGQLCPDRALPRPIEPGDPWQFEGRAGSSTGGCGPARRGGTSQMVAVDRWGNLASVITAVGWNYGSLVYEPETGVFLNNGMLYFDPRPGRPASIAPGKRPLFGAPPLVAVAGDRRLAIAGSGGYRIESGVLHTLLGRLRHGLSLEEALEQPRVHCQGRETFVDERLPVEQVAALGEMGHDVVVLPEDAATLHFGRVSAVEREGGRTAASGSPVWMSAADVR